MLGVTPMTLYGGLGFRRTSIVTRTRPSTMKPSFATVPGEGARLYTATTLNSVDSAWAYSTRTLPSAVASWHSPFKPERNCAALQRGNAVVEPMKPGGKATFKSLVSSSGTVSPVSGSTRVLTPMLKLKRSGWEPAWTEGEPSSELVLTSRSFRPKTAWAGDAKAAARTIARPRVLKSRFIALA